jgi:hypothetical protein
MAMDPKFFICSKFGRKPPEVTHFSYGDGILCGICRPPVPEEPEMSDAGVRAMLEVCRIAYLFVYAHAESDSWIEPLVQSVKELPSEVLRRIQTENKTP